MKLSLDKFYSSQLLHQTQMIKTSFPHIMVSEVRIWPSYSYCVSRITRLALFTESNLSFKITKSNKNYVTEIKAFFHIFTKMMTYRENIWDKTCLNTEILTQ